MLTRTFRRSLAGAIAVAAVCSAVGASSAFALNPQPLPPAPAHAPVFLNPQPLPPLLAGPITEN